MFDAADCADKCVARLFQFPTTGSYKVDTQLSRYTRCMIYHQLMAVYLNSSILISGWVRLRIPDASSRMENFTTVCQGLCHLCVHLQRRGEFNAVCIGVGTERVAY